MNKIKVIRDLDNEKYRKLKKEIIYRNILTLDIIVDAILLKVWI